MKYETRLKIADIVFQVSSRSQGLISRLKQSYAPFLSARDPHLAVSFNFTGEKRKRPSALAANKVNWEKKILFLRAESFAAKIDFSERTAKFLSGDQSSVGVSLRLLCSVMLAKSGGLLLHSSAVLNKGFAYVFFGPSESGKTTIARLSKDKVILTDETTAIIKKEGAWHAFSTPFAGEFGQPSLNTCGPIKALFSIIKDSDFNHRRLLPASAAKALSVSAFLQAGDFRSINASMAALDGLARDVPCYDLGFKAKPYIWKYVNGFIR